jgi:Tfp pilus assembly protein PilN
VLRTNLSTRPFYNERAVHLLLAGTALVVMLLTALNAYRIITLSGQNTELSSLINNDRNEAQRLTREAQKIRAGINQDELSATAAAAEEANRLIDQRTFSWTEFFNRIEETLPPDVMLTSVQPSFANDVTTVQMSVLARRSEDLDEFMEKLEATGSFEDVLPIQEDPTDEGLHRVLLTTVYTGEGLPEDARPESAAPGKPAASPAAVDKPEGERGKSGTAGRGGRGQ